MNPKIRHNYWAILVAALVYFVLGAGWFTLFTRQWMEGTGLTMDWLTTHAAVSPAIPYAVAFGSAVLIAFALSCVTQITGPQTALNGAKVAVLLWLGFVFTTWATEYFFEERSIQILAIVSGYPLVGMVIEGLIVGAWKKK
jgi:hypothetical protein